VEAFRELVRPLAIHYARCSQESPEDLLQVGMLGLIRAAELYRKEQATPFEAFARPHIRGAILHYLRDSAPIVRLPRRQAELQERLIRLSAAKSAEPAALAAEAVRRELRIGLEQWNLLLRQRRLNRPRGLEGVLAAGLEGRLQGLDPVDEPAADDGAAEQEAGSLSAEQLLGRLQPRQRQVVRQAVLEGASYRTIAAAMGISPMTVKRLLHRGLDELREVLDGDGVSCPPSPGRAASAAPGC
jgi:RNA polymerase sigma-B factor